jgi:glycosyltransferase involved in cell wall biosynthesis
MAAAGPVVATDVGGTPDAIRQGTTGLLVPPSDPSRLPRRSFGSTRAGAPDEARQRRLCRRARRYSTEAVIGQVEALYSKLASRRWP